MEKRLRRPVAVAMLLVMTEITVGAIGPAASAASCSVKNSRTGITYARLQRAVDSAKDGDTLRIRGTCVGTTTITGTDLTLRGLPTDQQPTPTLDGGGVGRVLVLKAARFVIRDLTLTNGAGVRFGGGVYLRRGAPARLSLKGSTSVTGNTAEDGGGVYTVEQTVTLGDSASISSNTATFGFGGGIYSYGRVVLRGSASVSGNSAGDGGGGIFAGALPASVYLFDSASVTGNTAENLGGGIWAAFGVYVCSELVELSPNDPDDPPKNLPCP